MGDHDMERRQESQVGGKGARSARNGWGHTPPDTPHRTYPTGHTLCDIPHGTLDTHRTPHRAYHHGTRLRHSLHRTCPMGPPPHLARSDVSAFSTGGSLDFSIQTYHCVCFLEKPFCKTVKGRGVSRISSGLEATFSSVEAVPPLVSVLWPHHIWVGHCRCPGGTAP